MNVLITGASTGIGAATARHLLEQGMTVFAGVESEADQVPSGARRLVLDVGSDTSIASAFAGLDELHAVVNNAGIGVPGPLEALPLDQLRRQLDVNVGGQVAVTQAALPLIRRSGGRIVFVGSVGGILASQFAGAYHASKFAIEAIADVWRQELDPEGIPVVLIEPAVISTPIWDKAIARLDALEVPERYRERLSSFRDSLRSADEHGKDPADVAEVIAEALTSDKPDTRYVVGGAGKIATALRPLIPDRVADKLAERTI
jgi:NAD(P)-dependent dehydrogenase (short-subunit alcohol dehydrogenase family)